MHGWAPVVHRLPPSPHNLHVPSQALKCHLTLAFLKSEHFHFLLKLLPVVHRLPPSPHNLPVPSQALKCHLSGALWYIIVLLSPKCISNIFGWLKYSKDNVTLNVSVSTPQVLLWYMLYFLRLEYVCNIIFQEGTISLSCLKSSQIIFPTPGNIFSFCFYNKKKIHYLIFHF